MPRGARQQHHSRSAARPDARRPPADRVRANRGRGDESARPSTFGHYIDRYSVTVYNQHMDGDTQERTMAGDEQGLTIEELARRADVPVRTVRFYIAERLLPGPGARGRDAVYSEEHLLRLLLVRRLSERGQRLGEDPGL